VIKHPLRVPGWDKTLEDLAREVSNLRYDRAVEFLNALSSEFRLQSVGDLKRGRPKLAASLTDLADHLDAAREATETAWTISRPHMKDEL